MRPKYCKLHYHCGGIAVEGCCCCNDCNYFKNGRMEPILRPNEANSNDVMIIYEDQLDKTNIKIVVIDHVDPDSPVVKE